MFSSSHGTFSRIDSMLSHKISLGKLMKTEIISNIFSNHNAMRLENNHKKKKKKTKKKKNVEAKQYVTKQRVNKYIETNESETMMIQNLRDAAKAVLRGNFIVIHA